MPKVIKEDQASTWTIDGDSKTWTLQEQATIAVNGTAAIDILDTSLANRLKLLGDIVASGDGGYGVHASGVDTKILLGKEAEIDADEGIHGSANGLRIVNKGEIDGLLYGVSNTGTSTIKNSGDISGDSAISLFGSGKVINGEDGMIQGDFAGINMFGASNSSLTNHGTISGIDFAIRMVTGGENTLVNTGEIHGDILFGIGNDLLDSRTGIIEGTVTGGDGDDVYKIGKNDIAIVEAADQGFDSVYSIISHHLSDDVEQLVLTGKRNAEGYGNDDDNVIVGNKGENQIRGRGGDDEIGGGRGDDQLWGEAGNDLFIFKNGDDQDSIWDFDAGDDRIHLEGFEGVTDFTALQSKMFKNGSDVWIEMGDDLLILRNTDTSELDASHFSFAA
jgi:Ca2+-binding RTX toxin-like protein